MNKWFLSFIILIGSLLLGWWLFQEKIRHLGPGTSPMALATNTTSQPADLNLSLATSPTITAAKTIRTQASIGIKSIRLFKSTNYPPQTAEEKTMWEWWDEMEKTDPDWQWKMPIEFYGKVIDQFGQPIRDAKVILNWTTAIGPSPDPKRTLFTGPDGKFAIGGIQGKNLWIAVSKDGYLFSSNSVASFEYAAFYQNDFHVPDPNNPVLFHLQKLMGAEPMYEFQANSEMAFGGPPVDLDVASGKLAKKGDFAFSLTSDGRNEQGPNYTLQLQARNNAGFVLTTERFPFNAPENGYQTEMSIHQNIADTNYNRRQTFHFYAKTHDSKYGVVWFEVNVPGVGESADCNATIRYNPSGSRNLEFDQSKWINR